MNIQETREYDLLQHIKFCLECKNESQAIRLIEKYGFQKQQTLEEVSEMHFEWTKDDETLTCKDHFISGAKWQQEQFCNSEFLQTLRATKSDAEARRLIIETFKNK